MVCELKFEHPTIDFFIKILVDCAYTISKANFDDIHVVINVTIKIWTIQEHLMIRLS